MLFPIQAVTDSLKAMRGLILFATVIFALKITYGAAQLTNEEKDEILDLHNNYRRWVQPEAANMEIMQWSSCLEQVALNYLSTCPGFDHNSGRTADAQALECEASSYVGENLYWSSNYISDVSKPVKAWYEEYTSYDISSKSCSGVCGHFTQIVWATSYLVGCSKYDATTNCGSGDSGTYFICNYAPGGNINGVAPYTTGTQCFECKVGYEFCINGLCSETSGGGKMAGLCVYLIYMVLIMIVVFSLHF